MVPVAELISRQLPLERGYWMVVAAATVLRPEFGATLTRGVGACDRDLSRESRSPARSGGAAPDGQRDGRARRAARVDGATRSFAASFAVGFGFITAMVVFLLNVVSPDTLATAGARLLGTLVGGTIGLLAYALWPT